MGFDKLLAPLGDLDVLSHTLLRFFECPQVTEIVLVCPAVRFDALLLPDEVKAQVKRVDGGAERHHSVMAGLQALTGTNDYVAIHDGARPLVTVDAVTLCLEQAMATGAATLARPATETIKRASADQEVESSVSRDNLWFMETPQIFANEKILQAYQEVEAQKELVTDEVSALQLIGQLTSLVSSPCFNPKITYPTDLELAHKFLQP